MMSWWRARRRRLHAALGSALLLGLAGAAIAQDTRNKPPVRPGTPTRGFAAAVLLDGLDYTKPEVAKRLARDGEGVAIGYDAVDDDARPYSRDSAHDAVVLSVPALVMPVRVDATTAAWTRAFAYLKRLPTRVVVVLATPPAGVLQKEAATAPDRLLIVPATLEPKASAPNVLTVAALPAPGAGPVRRETADIVLVPAAAAREAPTGAGIEASSSALNAAAQASGLLACVDTSKARTAADVVTAIVARGQRGAAGTAPLIEMCVAR